MDERYKYRMVLGSVPEPDRARVEEALREEVANRAGDADLGWMFGFAAGFLRGADA